MGFTVASLMLMLIVMWGLGSSKRYWFAEPAGGAGEEEAQTQTPCSVPQFLLHGIHALCCIVFFLLKLLIA